MKKLKLGIVLILIILSLFLFGKYNSVSEPPKIKVFSGNTEIPNIVAKNKWDGAVYDREDTFKTIMKNTTISDLPYIELSEEIQIEFEEKAPSSIELQDYILCKDGSIKYIIAEKNIPTSTIKLKNKKAVFKLMANPAALLSSSTSDYEAGSSLRGFRFICKWGENECEYAFVLRSDAK